MVQDCLGDDFVLRSWVQLLLWKYFGFSPFGYRNEVKKVPHSFFTMGGHIGPIGPVGSQVRSAKKLIIRLFLVQSTLSRSLDLNGPKRELSKVLELNSALSTTIFS